MSPLVARLVGTLTDLARGDEPWDGDDPLLADLVIELDAVPPAELSPRTA